VPEGWEWVVLAIVAVLLFGGTRLAGVGKSAGRAIREFKEETAAISKKDEPATPDVADAEVKKPVTTKATGTAPAEESPETDA